MAKMNLNMVLNLKDKATAQLKKFNKTLDKTNAKMKKNAKLSKGGRGASGASAAGGLGLLGGTAAIGGLATVGSLIKSIAMSVKLASGNVMGLTNAFNVLLTKITAATGATTAFGAATNAAAMQIAAAQGMASGEWKAIHKVGLAAENTSPKIARLGSWFDKVKFKILAFGAAAFFALGSIIKSGREYEKLKATLKSVIPAEDNVAEAFAFVQQVASKLPTTLQETTTAFIRMQALGIVPTEERMLSFGNTASAMGKSVLQFTEAVADAIVGEMERLKEFGIKASQEGNKVTFTFQGISKTVGKNAKEITEYLESIGNVQFAGAAARQMDTLDGKLSNLGDSFSTLGNTIFEAGIGTAVKKIVDLTASMVGGITWLVLEIRRVFAFAAAGAGVLTANLIHMAKSIFAVGDAQERLNRQKEAIIKLMMADLVTENKTIDALQDGTAAAEAYNEKLKERLALQNKQTDGPILIEGGHQLKSFNEFMSELNISMGDHVREQENAALAQEKLNAWYDKGLISLEEYNFGMEQLQGILGDTEWSEFFIQAFRNMQSEMANFFDDAMTRKFSSFSDGMKQMGADFARVIRKMVAEWLAAKALTGAFGLVGINTAGPEFRAEGGPVTGGAPYVVGEQGPEIFVPDGNGEILPNGQGTGTSIQMNVTAIDSADLLTKMDSIKRGLSEMVVGTSRTYNLGGV